MENAIVNDTWLQTHDRIFTAVPHSTNDVQPLTIRVGSVGSARLPALVGSSDLNQSINQSVFSYYSVVVETKNSESTQEVKTSVRPPS